MSSVVKFIEILNELVELCHVANKGYKEHATQVPNNELRTLFYKLSQQRALFEAELKDDIRHLGGETVLHESWKGTLRESWINFKSAFIGENIEKIIEECKKEEKTNILEYEKALKEELPKYIKEKVYAQYRALREAEEHLSRIQQQEIS